MGKTIVTSGYFDPLHVGHLELIELSKGLGDKLIVVVNNDEQARLKKGKPFMPHEERMKIISALKWVDEVVLSIDKDRTVCETLKMLASEGKCDVFAKGGDRTEGEIPESPICRECGIEIIDGLGAKIQSSSELIKNAEGDEHSTNPKQ